MVLEQVETTERLVGLRDEWASLWSNSPDATPFQHPAWLISWWLVLGAGELRVTAIRERQTLIGLVPLFRNGGPEIMLGSGVTDYLEVLLGPGHPHEVLIACLTGRRCDFDCLRENSP